MRQVVVDASAVLAWLTHAQATPASLAMLDELDALSLLAPAIFAWEVENALLSLRRAQRLTARGHADARAQLTTLNVTLAPAFDPSSLVAQALKQSLSLFDCAYLHLAQRRSAALATRDGSLVAAAVSAGVDVIDFRRAPAP